MAFLIQSDDGRMRMCTASAERAASYLLFLSNAGIAAIAICVNGRTFNVHTLLDYAASLHLAG